MEKNERVCVCVCVTHFHSQYRSVGKISFSQTFQNTMSPWSWLEHLALSIIFQRVLSYWKWEFVCSPDCKDSGSRNNISSCGYSRAWPWGPWALITRCLWGSGRNSTPFLTHSSTLHTVYHSPSHIWPGVVPYWPLLVGGGATYRIRHTHSLPCRGDGVLPPRCPRIVCLVVKHLGFWRRQGSRADPQSHCKQPEKASQKCSPVPRKETAFMGAIFQSLPIWCGHVWARGGFLANSRRRCLQRAGCQEPSELYINVKCILGIN